MTLDLEKTHHWGTVFNKNCNKPILPEQLTSKWWSKHKQFIAAGKETGIGEALDKLQKLYLSVDFPFVIGRPDTREQDTKKCEEAINSTGLSAFVKQLKAVQKLAEDHAKDFTGSAYKKTATALADILEAAQEVEKVCSEKHLRTCLESALSSAKDKKLEKILENAKLVFEARDGVLSKLPEALKNIKDELGRYVLDHRPTTGQALGNTISRIARDMTQVLFNMEKIVEGGLELEKLKEKEAKVIRKGLEQWADTKEGITYDTPTEAVGDVKKFGEFVKAYVLVVKPVKLK